MVALTEKGLNFDEFKLRELHEKHAATTFKYRTTLLFA
jgi:hypothetical protein